MREILLSAPPDFSFHETLSAHGWRLLLPFSWHEDTQVLERSEELAVGAVVQLRLQGREGGIHVEIEGAGDADEICRRVRRMFQLDLSLSDFHGYCRSRPELTPLAVCQKGRLLRGSSLFEDVVKVIATTNTTWGQTIAMTRRLVDSFGAGGCCFPTPQRLATAPFEGFAAKARMGYRSAFVYALATAVAGGTLDLEAWQDDGLEASALRKRLLALPGIGPYGAACLMLYLGKPEHVNADSVARALLSQELGRPVTDKDVQAFFEEHGEWRGLVYNFYPWRQGG